MSSPQCDCEKNAGFPYYYTGSCHKIPEEAQEKVLGIPVPQVPLVDWQLPCANTEGFGNFKLGKGPLLVCIFLLVILAWFLYQKYGQR